MKEKVYIILEDTEGKEEVIHSVDKNGENFKTIKDAKEYIDSIGMGRHEIFRATKVED